MLQRMSPQSFTAHIGLSGGEGEREHKVRGVGKMETYLGRGVKGGVRKKNWG